MWWRIVLLVVGIFVLIGIISTVLDLFLPELVGNLLAWILGIWVGWRFWPRQQRV